MSNKQISYHARWVGMPRHIDQRPDRYLKKKFKPNSLRRNILTPVNKLRNKTPKMYMYKSSDGIKVGI